ncbi:D-hexose-6-phosphate mutarotase [Colwellia sp. MEBiC06753]
MNVIKQNQWGQVSLEPLADQQQQLVISHENCTARVSLYGGQVLAWQPSAERPVFWLSESSSYETGKAIRGGIPLCWPWFGGYKDAGNHGFARQVTWQCQAIEIFKDCVELTLEWQGSDVHPLWPYQAKLTQKLVFGKAFEQQLEVNNLSAQSFEFTVALHSYFCVSEPSNVSVPALNNVPFDCKLTGNKAQVDTLANVVGPLDRIYHATDVMTIIDKLDERAIIIEPINVKNWVLWNPGYEAAQSMSDVHAGGENEYVCLEAANTDWQTLAAGQSALIGQRIRLETFTV